MRVLLLIPFLLLSCVPNNKDRGVMYAEEMARYSQSVILHEDDLEEIQTTMEHIIDTTTNLKDKETLDSLYHIILVNQF